MFRIHCFTKTRSFSLYHSNLLFVKLFWYKSTSKTHFWSLFSVFDKNENIKSCFSRTCQSRWGGRCSESEIATNNNATTNNYDADTATSTTIISGSMLVRLEIQLFGILRNMTWNFQNIIFSVKQNVLKIRLAIVMVPMFDVYLISNAWDRTIVKSSIIFTMLILLPKTLNLSLSAAEKTPNPLKVRVRHSLRTGPGTG